MSKPNRQERDDIKWAKEHHVGERLDPGIVRILRIFREHGIETCQSCEGPDGVMPEGRNGSGHCYENPTIDVAYQPWHALDVANIYGAQVDRISEVFRIEHGRPVERIWRIEFNSRQLAQFRESWYGHRRGER